MLPITVLSSPFSKLEATRAAMSKVQACGDPYISSNSEALSRITVLCYFSHKPGLVPPQFQKLEVGDYAGSGE